MSADDLRAALAEHGSLAATSAALRVNVRTLRSALAQAGVRTATRETRPELDAAGLRRLGCGTLPTALVAEHTGHPLAWLQRQMRRHGIEAPARVRGTSERHRLRCEACQATARVQVTVTSRPCRCGGTLTPMHRALILPADVAGALESVAAEQGCDVGDVLRALLLAQATVDTLADAAQRMEVADV